MHFVALILFDIKTPLTDDKIMDFWNRNIILVTGKGGVGKSFLAASIALKEADRGKRTLLVEFGSKSFYGPFLGLSDVDFDPAPVKNNLWVSRWNTETCLRDYVLHFVKVKALIELFFNQRVTRSLINAAPALPEIALLGKLTSGIRVVGPPLDFDRIVVDAYSTGHLLALIRAPRGIGEVVKYGPIGLQSREIFKVMTSADHIQYVIATLADELPTIECLELQDILRKEFNIEPYVMCNRLVETPDEPKGILDLPGNFGSEFKRYLLFRKQVVERQKQNLDRIKNSAATVWTIPQFYIENLEGMPLMEIAQPFLEKPWTIF